MGIRDRKTGQFEACIHQKMLQDQNRHPFTTHRTLAAQAEVCTMMAKFRTFNRYRTSLASLLFLTTLISCTAGTPRKPNVECGTTQHLTPAALCLKAVTANFGPADELVGYTPIPNLNILLLAQGVITVDDEGNLQQPSSEALQELGQDAQATDEQGDLTLFVQPGEYVLCVFRISPAVFPEKLSYCERISIAAGGATEILVHHSPMGGFITFEQNR